MNRVLRAAGAGLGIAALVAGLCGAAGAESLQTAEVSPRGVAQVTVVAQPGDTTLVNRTPGQDVERGVLPLQPSFSRSVNSRINQFIADRVLSGILLGATQQISCSTCFSAFGAAGSVSGGAQGRYNVTDSLTVIGGASVNSFRERGADVRFSPSFALALRYDPADMGPSRPFFEVGGYVSPGADVRYTRLTLTPGPGNSGTSATAAAGFVRVGWVARLSPRDEVAVLTDVSTGVQRVSGYTESAFFPGAATRIAGGSDHVNIARVGGQYTSLLTDTIEANISGAFAYAFDQSSGLDSAAAGLGRLTRFKIEDTPFFEGGARVGFRVSERSVIDVFAVTAAGPQPIGRNVHGGLGWRYQF